MGPISVFFFFFFFGKFIFLAVSGCADRRFECCGVYWVSLDASLNGGHFGAGFVAVGFVLIEKRLGVSRVWRARAGPHARGAREPGGGARALFGCEVRRCESYLEFGVLAESPLKGGHFGAGFVDGR
jgi:hypothetical protein